MLIVHTIQNMTRKCDMRPDGRAARWTAARRDAARRDAARRDDTVYSRYGTVV